MMKTYSTELAGRRLEVEIGKVAELANGSAMVRYGDTVVLATVVASDEPREGIDFFPLNVNYEEKLYAVGRIPGGFIKREGRPTEAAILTSRVIDRPLRPLFPEDYYNDVVLTLTVLSVDQDCSPEVAAMIGASIVLDISDIPFAGPLGSVHVGYIDGEYVINPTLEQREVSDMALTVSSTKDKVMAIEAAANELSNEVMYEGIMFAHEENQKIVSFIQTIKDDCGLEKAQYETSKVSEDIYQDIATLIGDKEMEDAVFTDDKETRSKQLGELTDRVMKQLEEKEMEEHIERFEECFNEFEKQTVRRMILEDGKRPDGRKLDEVRPLSSEIDILPKTHGTGLFTRGQTQVLSVITLAQLTEMQYLDGLDELDVEKRYMHHYNFPPYSVGEARAPRSPGRREIGHGALSEKALLPVLPDKEEFPYAIRGVSEILSSNGSTSQASICACSLSLMAAGVPIKSPVAGISVGLVTGETDDDFVLLTDIQGLEDFYGDMDFKVAGTKNGITAIQMDMKIQGLTNEIIKGALENTQASREVILANMNEAISEPRAEVSENSPKIVKIDIDPEKISEVIGPKGRMINQIIDETGVKIDIEDDGQVYICGTDDGKVQEAVEIIEGITREVQEGDVYEGTVKKIMNFGAFVEILPGKEGLVHISKIAHERIANVEDVLSEGDKIMVKVIEIDRQNRINLSRKAMLANPQDKDN
ncbi:MAG: polyribonucleotide nucleotidyltransferase [Epulopiscium sp.]|nr:polyribonucleotide nucleotidyltransferase [Candidatus Epulonipiscium sp.]